MVSLSGYLIKLLLINFFWVEGSFDDNSLKVAELLFKNGFREAYAIRGEVKGKNGWLVFFSLKLSMPFLFLVL